MFRPYPHLIPHIKRIPPGIFFPFAAKYFSSIQRFNSSTCPTKKLE